MRKRKQIASWRGGQAYQSAVSHCPCMGKKGECDWMEGISVFLPRAWERAAYSQGQNRTFRINLK